MTSSISVVELINALKCLKANNLANQRSEWSNTEWMIIVFTEPGYVGIETSKKKPLSLLRYSSGRRNFRGRPRECRWKMIPADALQSCRN